MEMSMRDLRSSVRCPRLMRGTSMIEVLVTLVIVAIGLLGLAGLQSRLQVSEMEAYQRAQALILLNDMASRLAANRRNALDYDTGGAVGVGTDCAALGNVTRQQQDATAWCNALQGAGETLGGSRVGAMVGGRGCVQAIDAETFLISVAWQGLTPISVPVPACGQGAYDTAGTACTGDLCRRVITTIVRIGNLT
jgi:type IV pilus assembly protein PilV